MTSDEAAFGRILESQPSQIDEPRAREALQVAERILKDKRSDPMMVEACVILMGFLKKRAGYERGF